MKTLIALLLVAYTNVYAQEIKNYTIQKTANTNYVDSYFVVDNLSLSTTQVTINKSTNSIYNVTSSDVYKYKSSNNTNLYKNTSNFLRESTNKQLTYSKWYEEQLKSNKKK